MTNITYYELKRNMTKKQLSNAIGKLVLQYLKVPKITRSLNRQTLRPKYDLIKNHKTGKAKMITPHNLGEIKLFYGNRLADFCTKLTNHGFNVANTNSNLVNDFMATDDKMLRIRNSKGKTSTKNKQTFKPLKSLNNINNNKTNK